MKKKFLLLALIMVMAVSSLFAASNVFFVTGSPYAKQFVKSNLNTNNTSDYGFGFKAGYRHFNSVVLWGLDVTYQNYNYYNSGSDTHAYIGNIMFLAKVGGKVVLSEKIDLNGDIGCGIDLCVSRIATNCNFVLAGSGSFSFYANSKAAMVVGMDCSVEWAKDSLYKTVTWNLVPYIGAEIDF